MVSTLNCIFDPSSIILPPRVIRSPGSNRRSATFCVEFAILLIFMCANSNFIECSSGNGFTPEIPSHWKGCAQNICQNQGTCFEDGTSAFCVCPEHYGGKVCERLIDSLVILPASLTPNQILVALTTAIILFVLAMSAALVGWLCCLMKHLNAHRLYLRNLKLSRKNRWLDEEYRCQIRRSVRLYAALCRAMSLVDEEQDQFEQFGIESGGSNKFSINARGAGATPGTPVSLTAATTPLAQTPLLSTPHHRRLFRELSQIHDELKHVLEDDTGKQDNDKMNASEDSENKEAETERIDDDLESGLVESDEANVRGRRKSSDSLRVTTAGDRRKLWKMSDATNFGRSLTLELMRRPRPL